VNINIDKLLKIAGAVSALLVLLFGISLATVRQRIVLMVKVPELVPTIVNNLEHTDSLTHILIITNQMLWEAARVMTDNRDTIEWRIVLQNGNSYDVDIRNTAEGFELAFISKLNVIYPLRRARADGRRYVVLHKEFLSHDEEPNIYLYKKSE